MLRAVAVTMDSIMKPVFGTPHGTGVGPTGGMATQTPTRRRHSGYVGFCWCLSTMTKPRGLTRPSMPRNGAMPRKAGSIIEKPNGSSRVALTEPSSAISSIVILPGFDLLDPRAGHPLDVVLAHFAFEQALGVADAVEAEMADIGLGR